MPSIPTGPPGMNDIVDTDRLHFQAYSDTSDAEELKVLEDLLLRIVNNTHDIGLLKSDMRRMVSESSKVSRWLDNISGLLSSSVPVIRDNTTAEFEFWKNRATSQEDLLAALLQEFPETLKATANRVDGLAEQLEKLTEALQKPATSPNRTPMARTSPEPLSAPSREQVRRAFALAAALPEQSPPVAGVSTGTESEISVNVSVPEATPDDGMDSGILAALLSIDANLVRIYKQSLQPGEKDRLPVLSSAPQRSPARLLSAPTLTGNVIDAEFTQIHRREPPQPATGVLTPEKVPGLAAPVPATQAPVLALPAPVSATPQTQTLVPPPAPEPKGSVVTLLPAPTPQAPPTVVPQLPAPAPVTAGQETKSTPAYRRADAKKSYLDSWRSRQADRLKQLHTDRKETEAANAKHRQDYASRLVAQEQAKLAKQQLALQQSQQVAPASGGSSLLETAAEAAGDLLGGKKKYRYVGKEAPLPGGVPETGAGRAGGFLSRNAKWLGRAGGALAVAGGAYGVYDALSSDKSNQEKAADVGGSVGGAAGSLAGMSAGASVGAGIGTVLAPVTGGLSIPVGAALGAIGGGVAGYFGGESLGRAGGSVIGGFLPTAEPAKKEPAVTDSLPKTEHTLSKQQMSPGYQALVADNSHFGSIDYEKLRASYGDDKSKSYHAVTAGLVAAAAHSVEEKSYPYLRQVPYVEKVAPAATQDPSVLAVSNTQPGKAQFAQKVALDTASLKVDTSALSALPDQMESMTTKLERDSKKAVNSTVTSNEEMLTATKSWADKALDFFKDVKEGVSNMAGQAWSGVQAIGRGVGNAAEAVKEGAKTTYQVATGQKDVAGSSAQSFPQRAATAVSEGVAAAKSTIAGRTAIGTFTEREESGAKGASALNLNDVNNIAYGKIQFNSKYGNFQKVMQQYLDTGDKSSANYQKIAQYKDTLTNTKNTGAIRDAVRGDKSLQEAMKGAGKEDAMKAAQERVASTEYATPASAVMAKTGAKSVAASQVFYDTQVQSGAAAAIAKETTAKLGGKIGDVGRDGQVITDQSYLNSYLDIRKGRLLNSNKQAAATAGPRIDGMRKIANDKSLLDLQYDPKTQNVKTDEKGNLVTVAGSTVAPESVSGITRKDAPGVRAEAYSNANPTAARNMNGVGAGVQSTASNAMYKESAKAAANGLVQSANDAMYQELNNTLGTKYVYGGKNAKSGIDCSGYVSHLNTTTMDAVNQSLGTTVFSKKDKALLQTSSSEQIRGIGAATGKEYSKEEMMAPGGLREGMIIGEDHAGAKSDSGKNYKGIDHVVQVVKNPETGELEIAQSSSKKGTWTQPLEQWKASRLKSGTGLYGVDPMLLAKNVPPEAAAKAAEEAAKTPGTQAAAAPKPVAPGTVTPSDVAKQTTPVSAPQGTEPTQAQAPVKPQVQKASLQTAKLPAKPQDWRQSPAQTAANQEQVRQPVKLSAQQSEDMDNIFKELGAIPGVTVAGAGAGQTLPATAVTQNGYTRLETAAGGIVPQSLLSKLGVNYPVTDKVGGYAEKAVGLLRKYGGERGNEYAQKLSQVTQGLGNVNAIPGFDKVKGLLGQTLPGQTPGFNPGAGNPAAAPLGTGTGAGAAYNRSVGSVGGLGDLLRTASTLTGRQELAGYASKLDSAPKLVAQAQSAYNTVSNMFKPAGQQTTAPATATTAPPTIYGSSTAPEKTTNPDVVAPLPMTESTGQSILASTSRVPEPAPQVSVPQDRGLNTAGTSMTITIDEFSLTAKAAYETLVLGKG